MKKDDCGGGGFNVCTCLIALLPDLVCFFGIFVCVVGFSFPHILGVTSCTSENKKT